ncbi:MAG TPA: hypothetical protein VK582_23205 [Pyrinomonadaceae bacterium]|nr:hypothetical protein [Pyrinomonadaceae bacterium]
MFCPQCGSTQNNELKFCKSCGVNLDAVRQAPALRDPGEKFDWSRTWVAEMFLSESERKRRNEQIQRERGITPEMKRYTEIKAGVITSSVGVGLMIFLYFLMQGIILSGQNPASDAAILGRIWIAGVIPFLVGLALIINGLFVSKRQVEIARQRQQTEDKALMSAGETPALRSADTAEFIPPSFGVTEGTTKHLSNPSQKR